MTKDPRVDDAFVVVPHRPGPLVVPPRGGGRDRDELDELIDDLFPDVDEGPDWFDLGLALTGIGLLAWTLVGDAPGIVAALGIGALALASILPLRSAWRWFARRSQQRHTDAHLAAGVALDASTRPVATLVGSYGALFDPAMELADPLLVQARAAAHAALLEVATLLSGRSPSTERELGYIDQRSVALSGLIESLQATPAHEEDEIDPDLLVAAREEIDLIAPVTAVTRLEQVATEARLRRGR